MKLFLSRLLSPVADVTIETVAPAAARPGLSSGSAAKVANRALMPARSCDAGAFSGVSGSVQTLPWVRDFVSLIETL
jgi:hypothetical protein